MTTISENLTKDHRTIDEIFASIEECVTNKSWSQAAERLAAFSKDLLLHLQKEEQIMFPAFEEATGMSGGPTAMMCMEHEQMRSMLSQLESALQNEDISEYAGVAETMHMLLQQHNMKEEQMLYRMADEHLSEEIDGLITKMDALG